MIVLVAILGIAVMGYFAISIWAETLDARQDDTREQLLAIEMALRGDSLHGHFGYLGDMGALPLQLTDLVVKPTRSGSCTGATIPGYSTASTYGVGMGWNGPYVDRRLFHQLATGDTVFKDEWGTPFIYRIVDAGQDPSLPAGQRYAQVKSAGPDATEGTADDLLADPIYERGQLRLRVQMGNSVSGIEPMSVSASLWYSCDGALAPTPLSSNTVSFSGSPGAEGYLEFPVTHHGPHAVRLQNGQQMQEPSVVFVTGGMVTKMNPTPPANRILVTYEMQCIPLGAPKGKTNQSANYAPC